MNKQIATIATIASLSSIAQARLGGFEEADGYAGFLNPVEQYNAGQYGANAGGGSFSSYNPPGGFDASQHNQGLWNRTQGTTFNGSYATAVGGKDRLTSDSQSQGLQLTTNADGWDGPAQIFEYTVDSNDIDANAINATSNVTFSIWSSPGALQNNTMSSDFFGNSIALRDSSGNVGVTVGYKMDQATGLPSIAYNVNGTWLDTGIAAAADYYQQWVVELDLANNTVNLSLIDGGYNYTDAGTVTAQGTGNQINLLTDQAMFQNMSDLASLEFVSTPGVTNSQQWHVDDASFTTQVPEPSSTALLGLGALGLLARRKR